MTATTRATLLRFVLLGTIWGTSYTLIGVLAVLGGLAVAEGRLRSRAITAAPVFAGRVPPAVNVGVAGLDDH